jgi:hypothetical protein
MYHTSLDYLDRLQAKNLFRGTTATFLGTLASLLLVAAVAAFYIPTVFAFFRGELYFQSEYQLQQSPIGNLTVNKDIKLALVFQNKTSLRTANHTLLKQFINILSFQTTSFGTTLKSDTTSNCDPNYFSNALNPP